MEVSFCNSLCISDIPENNDTLRLFREKHLCARDKGMDESASFVSDSSHHFSEKYRKLENNLQKACQSHFFFLFYVPINISILNVKADIWDKYHYNDR